VFYFTCDRSFSHDLSSLNYPEIHGQLVSARRTAWATGWTSWVGVGFFESLSCCVTVRPASRSRWLVARSYVSDGCNPSNKQPYRLHSRPAKLPVKATHLQNLQDSPAGNVFRRTVRRIPSISVSKICVRTRCQFSVQCIRGRHNQNRALSPVQIRRISPICASQVAWVGSRQRLRSATRGDLVTRPTSTYFGARSFAVAGRSTAWNQLLSVYARWSRSTLLKQCCGTVSVPYFCRHARLCNVMILSCYGAFEILSALLLLLLLFSVAVQQFWPDNLRDKTTDSYGSGQELNPCVGVRILFTFALRLTK